MTRSRYRATFAVSGPLRYAAVLDMGRLWERLLRRADVALSYSQGYTPHPALYLADALPVGYASVCELIDFVVEEPHEEPVLLERLVRQCPPGLDIHCIETVALGAPKPQSLMRSAEYRVRFSCAAHTGQVSAAIEGLMLATTLPRARRRKDTLVSYDLRPLIFSLSLVASEGGTHVLAMTLRCGSQGAGRPEEVVAALELQATALDVCRTRLHWEPKESHP